MLTSRFTDALVYATELHASQRRKLSDVPYVAHLLKVCGIVLEHGGSEDEAIAALLHDAVEDQGGAAVLAEIEQRFGPEVAEMVAGCSDADTVPKPPWRERKEAHVAHVGGATAGVRIIVAADKLDNARSLLMELRRRGPAVWEHFNGGRDGTLWYYQAMLSALQAAGDSPLFDELGHAVDELRAVASE